METIKNNISDFFNSYGLFSPIDFNDPVIYAIPGFVLLVIYEVFFYQIPKNLLSKKLIKTQFSSLGLGIGAMILDFGMKGITLSYFFWFYNNFRVTDFFGVGEITSLLSLDWNLSHWWLWILVFIVQDFGFYWHHRLSHQIRILWTAHSNHHSAEKLSFLIALRQGWGEILYRDIWYVPFILIGFHPIMIVTMHQINLIYQFWPHTESIGKLGWFDRIFNSPSNHRIHHSNKIDDFNNNYGGVLMVWDHLFGTFKKEEEMNHNYGIVNEVKSYNVFSIVFDEVKRLKNDISNEKSLKNKILFFFKGAYWKPNKKNDI